jgi:DNA invertase Pin-like site-specific DNA recombinase
MEGKSPEFVGYYRVSTPRQGRSGLGLEAQRAAVAHYLGTVGGILVQEFTEIETGRKNDRPELETALAACRRKKARLVIAKLDRLSRNVAFIATLMDSGVDFTAVDYPEASRLTLHILAAIAEHERIMISGRTKAALQAAKARGVRLGGSGDRLAKANREAAIDRANEIRPVLEKLAGLSARQIAVELTARGIGTPRGGRWHPQSVIRVMERLGL